MASSTLIELKESHGPTKDQPELPNGFFRQVLATPLIIDEGTQISLKSGFVDTIQSSQGKIDIDGTEVYKVGYTPFIQNFNKRAKIYDGVDPDNRTTQQLIFDNEAYFPCAGGTTPSGTYSYIQAVQFLRIKNADDNWGGDSIVYEYKNLQGVDTRITITLPPIPVDPHPDEDPRYDVAVNIPCVAGSFRLPSDYGEDKIVKKFKRKTKVSTITIKETSYNPNTLSLEPLAFEYEFSLPKGSYEPKHICELITEKLTNLENVATTSAGTDNDPIDNAFLKTNIQINEETGAYNGEGKAIYCNSTGNGLLQLPDSQHFPATSTDPANIVPGFSGNVFDSFVGSDQVVLEYDEDLQKCVWSQLHGNLYSAGTDDGSGGSNEDGSIIIQSQPEKYNTDGDPAKYIYASRTGCVAFNYLEPADFWYVKLGLDPKQCISFEPEKTGATIGTFTDVDTFKVKGGLIDGINTTNSFISSSSAITKNQFYYQVPTRSNLEATSTANTKVYALNSLNNPTLNEGYFLISIDGFDNNQMLINRDDEKQTIKAVVSRFYTSDSYTSFYNEGNIEPYTHVGNPLVLSGFNVKILNPEYQQSNIEADNTLYLEVIKPLKQLEGKK